MGQEEVNCRIVSQCITKIFSESGRIKFQDEIMQLYVILFPSTSVYFCYTRSGWIKRKITAKFLNWQWRIIDRVQCPCSLVLRRQTI